MNERIKQLRLKLGLSQEEFGNRLGMGRGAITNIELNKVEPKPLFVSLICREFRVREEWLRTGEGEMSLPKEPDAQLDEILGQIASSEDELIKKIIKAYWALDDKEKAAIRKQIDGLCEK